MEKDKKFNSDLQKGKYYEQKAVTILQNHGFSDIYQYEGNVPYYDMHATYKNKKVYIEVKYNSKADTFKSFIIELCKTDGTATGLTITKSHFYVLFSYTSYWIIKTKKLHILVKKHILNKLRERNIFEPTLEDYNQFLLNDCKAFGNYKYILLPYDTIEQHTIYKGVHKNTNTLKNIFNV